MDDTFVGESVCGEAVGGLAFDLHFLVLWNVMDFKVEHFGDKVEEPFIELSKGFDLWVEIFQVV